MFCRKCGKEIKDDAVFCESCGASQGEVASKSPVEVETSCAEIPTGKIPPLWWRVVKAILPPPMVVLFVLYALYNIACDEKGLTKDIIFVSFMLFIIVDVLYNAIMSAFYRKNFIKLKINRDPLVNKKVRKAIIAAHEKNGELCCPRCGSTKLTNNNRGFSAGKAAAGYIVAGGIGLAAGGIGSKKVVITCLNCGKAWEIGG